MKPLRWFPWNGSKRWLIDPLAQELRNYGGTGKYLDPFVGGGSVSFLMRQVHPSVPQAVSDANPWLAACYERQIARDFRVELPDNLFDYEYWRALTDDLIGELDLHDKVLRFAVCLTTAWGNRWKTETDGNFTKSSTPTNPKFTGHDYVRGKIEKFLQVQWLRPGLDQAMAADWTRTVAEAEPGDLVYLDPPYPETLGYGSQVWSLNDMLDVIDWISDAVPKGIHVVASNVADLERLYQRAGLRTFTVPCPTRSNTRRARVEVIGTSLPETETIGIEHFFGVGS